MPTARGANDYDLIVIGSGPAGQHAAIEAARHGLRVAVIEKQQVIGGACLHTGTMPSKSFREAVLSLTGWRFKCLFPTRDCALDGRVTMADIKEHIDAVTARELRVIEAQLRRHGIALLHGMAQFTGPHAVRVTPCAGAIAGLTAAHFVIATGTVAARPPDLPFDDGTVIDSDQLYRAAALPGTIAIIGGGVVAVEYASVFATLGTRVHLISRGPTILPYVDGDVRGVLLAHLRGLGVTFHDGAAVAAVERAAGAPVAVLDSGERVGCDMLMSASGRVGTAADLDPGRAGLDVAARGQLAVDAQYRTAVPHVFAAGDITGPPATASNAKEQGRLAARAILGLPAVPEASWRLPMGIYTIPEIAGVGRGEVELAAEAVPFVRGVARFGEVARGEIIGDTLGMMKLLFHRDTRQLLGVHVIGTSATELIQTGHAALHFGAGIDYFLNAVFAYPTLSECYKIAAYDAEAALPP